jgi:hypothetical protein
MNKHLDNIIQNKIKRLMFEQDSMEPSAETPESKVSPFSPEEQKFLGHFAKTGSRQLGILYSISDVGVREFIARSGNQLSCTPNILIGLLKRKYIKIIPYTGLGRNTDYTIELQLSLKSVEPFKDLAGAEAGADAAGGDMGGGDMGGGDMGGGMPPPPPPDAGGGAPPEEPAAEPAPEVAHVVKYGNLLKESAKITKQLIKELKSKKKVRR